MKRMLPFLPLLRLKPVAAAAKWMASRTKGPDDSARIRGSVELWGRATNDAGAGFSRKMRVAEGYAFTVLSALASVERILGARDLNASSGAWTPSGLFGADFVTSIEGTVLYEMEKAP
jgi:short subunit dehydrogenase-like uncharacterized protein